MHTVSEFWAFIAICFVLLVINFLADVVADYVHVDVTYTSLSDLMDEQVEVELIGPAHDKMTLSEFYDFWMLLTEDQKDDYINYSWDDQPLVK
jgi:hypothetical protein